MIKFPLKVLAEGPNNPSLDYKATILGQLRAVPEGGVTIETIRKSLKLIDKIEEAAPASVVSLEDEHYKYLVERFQTATWKFVCPNVVTFMDDLTGAGAGAA